MSPWYDESDKLPFDFELNMPVYKEVICQLPALVLILQRRQYFIQSEVYIQVPLANWCQLEFWDPWIAFGLIQCRSVPETQRVYVMKTSQK